MLFRLATKFGFSTLYENKEEKIASEVFSENRKIFIWIVSNDILTQNIYEEKLKSFCQKKMS